MSSSRPKNREADKLALHMTTSPAKRYCHDRRSSIELIVKPKANEHATSAIAETGTGPKNSSRLVVDWRSPVL